MRTFSNFLLSEIFGEPTDSTFSHDGKTYDLNGLLSATTGLEPVEIPVSKLDWIFKWDPITAKDEKRINAADLEAPILVSPWHNQLVVSDGLHRLAKAKRLGHETIKSIVVPQELLDRYQMRPESFG